MNAAKMAKAFDVARAITSPTVLRTVRSHKNGEFNLKELHG